MGTMVTPEAVFLNGTSLCERDVKTWGTELSIATTDII